MKLKEPEKQTQLIHNNSNSWVKSGKKDNGVSLTVFEPKGEKIS